MLFKSPSKELTCPAGLLVEFQGWETLNFHARLSVRQQLSCPKSQNPTFLMRICWSWNLNPSPERLWEMQNLIFYPPKCLCVCVCVYLQVGVSSATAVMRWHVDLSLSIAPRTPDPPQSNMSVPPPTTDEVVTITGTHHISPLTIITNDSNDLTQCFRWPPPNPCHDTGGGPPALLFLCVWLCSQQPHLLRVNTTLGTISPPLAKLLLTLFNWGLIACQQDVALAESLTQLLLILMIHPGLNHQE